MGETINCESLSGSFSAWLSKSKGSEAKAKWFRNSTRRYFTIDFDSQMLYYSSSEKQKRISQPVLFRDFIGAECTSCTTDQDKGMKAVKKWRFFPSSAVASTDASFVLKTSARDFMLQAATAAEAAKWVSALNAARDTAQPVDASLLAVESPAGPALNPIADGRVAKPTDTIAAAASADVLDLLADRVVASVAGNSATKEQEPQSTPLLLGLADRSSADKMSTHSTVMLPMDDIAETLAATWAAPSTNIKQSAQSGPSSACSLDTGSTTAPLRNLPTRLDEQSLAVKSSQDEQCFVKKSDGKHHAPSVDIEKASVPRGSDAAKAPIVEVAESTVMSCSAVCSNVATGVETKHPKARLDLISSAATASNEVKILRTRPGPRRSAGRASLADKGMRTSLGQSGNVSGETTRPLSGHAAAAAVAEALRRGNPTIEHRPRTCPTAGGTTAYSSSFTSHDERGGEGLSTKRPSSTPANIGTKVEPEPHTDRLEQGAVQLEMLLEPSGWDSEDEDPGTLGKQTLATTEKELLNDLLDWDKADSR